MKELWRFLWYAGASKEEYERCLPAIRSSNHRRLRRYLRISCMFFLGLTVLACLTPIMGGSLASYLSALLLCLVLLALAKMQCEQNRFLLNVELYCFISVIYAFGIHIGTQVITDDKATTFFVFMVVLPVVFTFRPLQAILNTLFADAAFVICVLVYKDPRVWQPDLINAVCFGLLAMIISNFIMQIMTENFIANDRLGTIAETDINTGLQNRNAFEQHREEYPAVFTDSIHLLYLDVNGLHEMNNTHGHAAGDRMLREVGAQLCDIFGREHCYRIGGDEFVAFALDKTDADVNAMVSQLTAGLKKQGYSAAVGVACQCADEIDLDALLRRAERRMYRDKEDHYRECGQNQRNG